MNSQQKAELLLNSLLNREYKEKELKRINEDINRNCTELFDLMVDEGCDEIVIQGIKFKPTAKRQFSLSGELKGQKWDDCGVWFDWLKKQKMEGVIRTKETVHPGTRNKILKDWVEEKKQLPAFIDENFHNTIKYSQEAVSRMANENTST